MTSPDERNVSASLPKMPPLRIAPEEVPAEEDNALLDNGLAPIDIDERSPGSSDSNQPQLVSGVDPYLGQQFGGYELTAKIGQGGMGVVYRGIQVSLERVVAVKILNKALYDNPEFIKRFEREAKSIARVNHPNILAVYDFGKNDQVWYMVTEFVEGTSLSKQIAERLVLRWDELSPTIIQCLAGLSYVGQSGIVHRDIKPDNILITREGIPKIADFGLAKDVTGNDNTDLTTVGMAMGTPAYMSPEQCMGRKLDGRSDIYSLGVAIYLALTGEKPFTGQSSFEIMTKQREYTPPAPHLISKNIPREISELVMRMMAKNPSDRWRDAEECRMSWLEVCAALQQPVALRIPTPLPPSVASELPLPVKRRSGEISLTAQSILSSSATPGGTSDLTIKPHTAPPALRVGSVPDAGKLGRKQTQEVRVSDQSEVATKPGSERHQPTPPKNSVDRSNTDCSTTERRLSQRSTIVEASACPKCGMFNRADASNCNRCQHQLRPGLSSSKEGVSSSKDKEAHADRLMVLHNYSEAANLYSQLAERETDKRVRSILRTKEREARNHCQQQQANELRTRSQGLMVRGGLKAGIEVLERGLREVRESGASSTDAEELITQELDILRIRLRNRHRIRVLLVAIFIAVAVVTVLMATGYFSVNQTNPSATFSPVKIDSDPKAVNL